MPSQMPAILQAVMKGQSKALADAHYPCWHLAPVTGLMNDPNGFCWSGGRYHLFYQWNPLACDHKYKCWGHWSSTDLLHWQHEPLALMPDKEYDRNGCYSGSAVNNQDIPTCILRYLFHSDHYQQFLHEKTRYRDRQRNTAVLSPVSLYLARQAPCTIGCCASRLLDLEHVRCNHQVTV